MKVYIVFEQVGNEQDTILGVFASEESAEKFANRPEFYWSPSVTVFILDYEVEP